MYPTLYHALLDLTGLDLPFLKFLNSFGFFVALAFVFASWTLGLELKRKEKEGLLRPVKKTVVEGSAPSFMDYLIAGLIGFIIGWKGIHLLLNFQEATADPQEFLLSGSGNVAGGIAVAALLIWLKWRNKKPQQKEVKRTEVQMMPHEHAGNITITAAIWGIIGAKLFHWLENPHEFLQFINSPSPSSLFSGLTMYGGLILAGAMVIRYFKRNGIPPLHGADSAAPGVMLAYGIGRIGCQVSGDGDWGIVNTAPAPTWMPQWLWAYDYPNNVNSVGVPLTDGRACFPDYCYVLPETVFPTPIYETVVCVLFFGLLWAYRKRARPAGMIFFSFLILNGIERFFVEKIRVNVRVWGDITQAEIIAVLLVLAGIAGIIWIRTKKTDRHGPIAADTTG